VCVCMCECVLLEMGICFFIAFPAWVFSYLLYNLIWRFNLSFIYLVQFGIHISQFNWIFQCPQYVADEKIICVDVNTCKLMWKFSLDTKMHAPHNRTVLPPYTPYFSLMNQHNTDSKHCLCFNRTIGHNYLPGTSYCKG